MFEPCTVKSSEWSGIVLIRRRFRFCAGVGIFFFMAIESVALTPLGDGMFGQWRGASAAEVKQACSASAFMAMTTFPNPIRNLFYA
jgi:hypothetical protein